MAEQRTTFPMLPVAHWWALRKKFKQSIPGVVTDGYLATVLKMQAQSARANVLPYLRDLGIIEKDGKTTDRANHWRDDTRYPKVCEEILKEVYPQELRDAVTDPTQREDAENWFAHSTKTGIGAARRMAQLYIVILEADPTKQPASEKAEKAKTSPKASAKHERKAPARDVPPESPVQEVRREPPATVGHHSAPPIQTAPGIHINLEVHISADSTTDQIDAIFASMAKHIYKRG